MSGRYLLDTNIIIGLFNGEAAITRRVDSAPEIFLSCVVLGELHFGATRSKRMAANLARARGFAATCVIVSIDAETSAHYGRIRGELRAKGKPIPENDIWIAASAAQHDLIVVTRDRHFKQVDGLQTEAW